MRSRIRIALCSVMLFTSAGALTAQKRTLQTFNGVWREVEVRVERPDSTFTRPPSLGMIVIHNGYFSQIWVSPQPPGVAQAARPATAEAKAARFDDMTANAGRFEFTDSTFRVHYEVAKNPARIGGTVTVRYRVHGDTLWQFTTAPWARDSTKTVRTTYTSVRQK